MHDKAISAEAKSRIPNLVDETVISGTSKQEAE
jgi:hypothetical protein